MLQRLQLYLSLIRFSHTVFALPFALLAGLMAWYQRSTSGGEAFRWQELVGILLCMVFGRSAAMAVNRIADRRLDALNPRTAGRHIPSGQLSVASVTAFAIFCALGFIGGTLLFLPQNPWPLYLSVPVLLFICGYSYAKRFTSLAHYWLGAALMLTPICAWIAIEQFDNIWPAVILGAAVLFWVGGFDIIYACQDVDVDRKHGLHSIPAKLGVRRSLRLAAASHAVTVGLLFAIPSFYPALGLIYYVGVGMVAGLLIYEHLLVKPDDLTRVNLAFFHVNAVISLGLLIIGAADLAW
jgi:4-hydroxybenzoate polyprenyltransferase